jgi:hypothetical protein
MNDDKPKFDFSQKLPSLPPPDRKTPSVPALLKLVFFYVILQPLLFLTPWLGVGVGVGLFSAMMLISYGISLGILILSIGRITRKKSMLDERDFYNRLADIIAWLVVIFCAGAVLIIGFLFAVCALH